MVGKRVKKKKMRLPAVVVLLAAIWAVPALRKKSKKRRK